jgi:hypothetical protein
MIYFDTLPEPRSRFSRSPTGEAKPILPPDPDGLAVVADGHDVSQDPISRRTKFHLVAGL